MKRLAGSHLTIGCCAAASLPARTAWAVQRNCGRGPTLSRSRAAFTRS